MYENRQKWDESLQYNNEENIRSISLFNFFNTLNFIYLITYFEVLNFNFQTSHLSEDVCKMSIKLFSWNKDDI